MAIEYISHTIQFNPSAQRIELTIKVKNGNTSASFSIRRTDDTATTKKSQKSFSMAANAEQTCYYYDYTAKPSEIVSYTITSVTKLPTTPIAIAYAVDDLILSHKVDNEMKTLKIAYNPDIASIKITTGDAITQTLGSKYPYFRRNGAMNYKQFNIGGLISYHEDSAFWSAPNLTGYGLSEADIERIKEKQFRDAVLDFLYDSKPKILKSTTEGCMIVKLTGISLTPNKQLGRSIYSFTAQATEYCDPSIENLVEYGKAFEGGKERTS